MGECCGWRTNVPPLTKSVTSLRMRRRAPAPAPGPVYDIVRSHFCVHLWQLCGGCEEKAGSRMQAAGIQRNSARCLRNMHILKCLLSTTVATPSFAAAWTTQLSWFCSFSQELGPILRVDVHPTFPRLTPWAVETQVLVASSSVEAVSEDHRAKS